jgi:hypothetical protein
MAATGSPKGALVGAVTPVAFLGVGQVANGLGFGSGSVTRAGLHGAAGGVLAELQGGSFGHGFVQAGLGKFLSANLPVPGGGMAAGAIHAVIIGGTIDELTGGKSAVRRRSYRRVWWADRIGDEFRDQPSGRELGRIDVRCRYGWAGSTGQDRKPRSLNRG